MKKLCSIMMIAVSLLLFTDAINAQTTQTKLNQVELVKQFIGTWEVEFAKDTVTTFVIKPFGMALECNVKQVTKGKILNEGRWLLGYDEKYDKILEAQISNDSPNISFSAYTFTSKNIFEKVALDDISKPKEISFMMKFEFKSPDIMIESAINNNKVIGTYTINRIKK
jgi:hypothetical protein